MYMFTSNIHLKKIKKYIMEDKRILHEQLMSEHRRLTNEIANIKSASFELNPEEIKKIQVLETQIKKIGEQLYRLYENS